MTSPGDGGDRPTRAVRGGSAAPPAAAMRVVAIEGADRAAAWSLGRRGAIGYPRVSDLAAALRASASTDAGGCGPSGS